MDGTSNYQSCLEKPTISQNDDYKCFLYAVAAGLTHKDIDKQPERVTNTLTKGIRLPLVEKG